MPLSHAFLVSTVAAMFSTTLIGFGVNGILRPYHALTFFELSKHAAKSEQTLVEAFGIIYGVRDIFMGLAGYACLYYRAYKPAGCHMLLTSAVAFADGIVCQVYAGEGAMTHWGYAPAVFAVGVILLGVFDGKPGAKRA